MVDGYRGSGALRTGGWNTGGSRAGRIGDSTTGGMTGAGAGNTGGGTAGTATGGGAGTATGGGTAGTATGAGGAGGATATAGAPGRANTVRGACWTTGTGASMVCGAEDGDCCAGTGEALSPLSGRCSTAGRMLTASEMTRETTPTTKIVASALPTSMKGF